MAHFQYDRGDQAADEALTWMLTPFEWQQSLKGVGADCKGLVAGVARELGWPEAMSVEALCGDYWKAEPERLEAGLPRIFDPVEKWDAARGDVLFVERFKIPCHLGIISEATDGVPLKMVHVYTTGPRCVIDGLVELPKVVSIWRWRTLDGY